MYVSHLSLLDFRSYAAADLELEPGVNAFVGRNGRGKTNLVEAIGYVATLGSHRVATDAPLIRAGTERAVVRTRIVRGDRASTVELEITQGRANRARINRGQQVRARDVLGILRTVLFAPEDLALVKGDPDGRRRFMDQLLVLMMPRVSAMLSDYDRVLRQRSALLKSARAVRRSGGSGRTESAAAAELATLDVWDARLAELGAEILSLRLQLVDALRPAVAAAYAQVSDADGDAEIDYRSSLPALQDARPPELSTGSGDNSVSVEHLRDLLLEALGEVRPQELERGVSLVGPHRDDLVLTLGGLPAKGYASHGESWSFALALRLASFRLLGGDPQNSADSPAFWDPDLGTDADPVLILDDVFAELDVRRRERLADLVLPARQVLVTAAVPEDVPAVLDGVRFHVEPGTVTRD
ncbi:DNA replication/repair protein RecF [Promicromonospora citrea]|uniref:DNA replication and repair protein RecF n=1 Tax=Promicromonospora citrea TaxID=43677 RepID=A0A8H9L2H5_9MICO|nr:DNA replication/repair protein RecF [Promicromonospora citrea]NNH50737.1 DNA replication/repair protein RecF [Promicromonospora citrea]GGM11934.1 DNA replication and repair protein RecF [Promicromonospora citrea]